MLSSIRPLTIAHAQTVRDTPFIQDMREASAWAWELLAKTLADVVNHWKPDHTYRKVYIPVAYYCGKNNYTFSLRCFLEGFANKLTKTVSWDVFDENHIRKPLEELKKAFACQGWGVKLMPKKKAGLFILKVTILSQ